jgi:putative FmdB family regulatory protein
MPIYDYQCECGHRFEAWNSVNERETSRCACGELARKALTPVRFRLDPTKGHFPTTTDRFERQHERANRDELERLGLRPTEKRVFI